MCGLGAYEPTCTPLATPLHKTTSLALVHASIIMIIATENIMLACMLSFRLLFSFLLNNRFHLELLQDIVEYTIVDIYCVKCHMDAK